MTTNNPSPNSKKYLAFLVTTLMVVFTDQYTKQHVLDTFSPGDVEPVIDKFFNLTLTFNRGAAFGLWTGLSDKGRIIALILSSLFAVGALFYFFRHPNYRSRLPQSGLAFILGGAIGNLIDRARFGAVVDFLDFYYGTYHWPAFNIADSMICIGVSALLLYQPEPFGFKDEVTPM